MTVAAMRRVDRYVGVVLCWLLGLPRRLAPTGRGQLPDEAPRRILAIKFFGMGSIILTTPALSLLRSFAPEAEIDYLTFESNRSLLEQYPLINNVMTIRTESSWSFFLDTLRTLRLLRRRHYDIVFDFEFFSKYSTLLSTLSGGRSSVGFALPTLWRSLHLTHQVQLSKSRHVCEAFCEQVYVVSGRQPVPPLLPPRILDEEVDAMERKLPLNGKPIVAINVNTGETFIERRWMPERFAILVTRLSELTNYEFYFIGNDQERPFVDSVVAMTACPQRCYNVAGVLTTAELGAFFLRCELVISSDSGPLHLAAAVGTPLVGLYGPESPAFYGPIGRETTVVYKKVACSPCMNIYAAKTFQCPFQADCMRAITVDEVLQAVEQACLHE